MARDPLEKDRFYYGMRRNVSADVHGQPLYDDSPLSQADFLNPTADDIFELGPKHDQDVARLYRILQNHFRHNQLTQVFTNAKMRWLDPALAQPRADIIIATADSPKSLRRHEFREEEWDGPPSCIIEVLSPRFVEADLTDKVELYARAGVYEYFILDSGLREDHEETAYTAIGYRLDGNGYTRIEPDADGMINSKMYGFAMGPNAGIKLNENVSSFAVIDSRSGNPIADDDLQQAARVAEVQGSRRASELGNALDFLRG